MRPQKVEKFKTPFQAPLQKRDARPQKVEKFKPPFQSPLRKREMTSHREEYDKRVKIKSNEIFTILPSNFYTPYKNIILQVLSTYPIGKISITNIAQKLQVISTFSYRKNNRNYSYSHILASHLQIPYSNKNYRYSYIIAGHFPIPYRENKN